MTPKPQTEANRRIEKEHKHQLRQTVARQKRLTSTHRAGRHLTRAVNCPMCDMARG